MQLTITPNFAQERALNMLRRYWKANDTFMVYSPTGSGKTGLAAFIVAGFARSVLCSVHHPDWSDG
ncbi:helicase [Escherichia coli]|uniref:Helicase n=1 Tax=Escherichia coli TaxID=562 RepID=A0A376M5K0_ECOLX|nr:helicase [Escherichia coli]